MPQKSQNKSFAKITFTEFSAFMLLRLHAKNQESSMHWFVIKHKKLILGYFLTKNPTVRLFPHKTIWVHFKPSCCCNALQKTRKVPWIGFSQNLKTSREAIWVPFGPKTQKQNFFQKKTFRSILSPHADVTSCKTPEKFHALTFDNM